MAKYVCSVCGFIYDEEKGIPEKGIKPGTKFEDLPEDFECPWCGAPKTAFDVENDQGDKNDENEQKDKNVEVEDENIVKSEDGDSLSELSYEQMSALCSNLAKGCEKQYLAEECTLFLELAEHYKDKAKKVEDCSFEAMEKLLKSDIEKYKDANEIVTKYEDRGALRSIVWSEKVSKMINSILKQYNDDKEKFLNGKNIYVCEICGFIYVGNELPEICPVCKVTNKKLHKIEGGVINE